jgi:RNA polymerase sigma-70 factor
MSVEPSLSRVFDALALEPELRDLCADLVVRAQAAHPTVRADVSRFAEKIVQQATQDGRREPALLLSLRAADLWLAFGCAAREAGALARFDVLFRDELDVVHRRVRPRGIDRDDFVQVAREKLFVKEPPKIAEYSGQGDPPHWLRVTLTRTLLDMSRKRQEELLGDLTPARASSYPRPKDPELDFMRWPTYKDAFRQAFERAARSLETDDRNLPASALRPRARHRPASGLLGVHRATAARRIGKRGTS